MKMKATPIFNLPWDVHSDDFKRRKNMKKGMIFTVCLMLLLMCSVVAADEGIKIGFIRTQRVILETQAGKEGYANLQSLVDQHRQRIQQKESEIRAMEQELADQGQMLTEQARLEKREDLQRAIVSLNRMNEDAQNEIGNREKILLDRIIEQLAKVIEKIGQDEGYTIILDADGPSVLFSDQAKDISTKVIEEFNKISQN
jgi:outer membrane protein